MIATKYKGDTRELGIAMQRPICSYPQVPVYNGRGDPNVASSFKCAPSETTAADNPKPAPQYGP